MDRTVSATEANARFAELLRAVAAGAHVTITSRGRPVARVLPFEAAAAEGAVDRLLAASRALPLRRSAPWAREDLYS